MILRYFYSLFFSLLLFVQTPLYAEKELNNPLPNWIDQNRETRDSSRTHLIEGEDRAVPPADFHLPAEYEPLRAVAIGWAGYTSMLRDIAVAVTNQGDAEVWAAEGPSSITGVLALSYKTVDCPINTVWMRDYGPVGILSDHSLAIVDTRYRHYQYRREDDRLPVCLGESQSIPSYTTSLILDGGNLMVDSKGNLFMTKVTYKWNSHLSPEAVDQALKDYFNVHTIHTFEYAGYPDNPADGTGHIDMFVKLLDDQTVMIAESSDEPFRTAINKALTYFQNLKTPDGGSYKIVRTPGYRRNYTWYTYTNSLIVNNIILVPSYSYYPSSNAKAQKVYEEAMPGKKAILIPSDDSIKAGGSIHCVTQQIPR